MSPLHNFFAELKRRNVYKVATGYALIVKCNAFQFQVH